MYSVLLTKKERRRRLLRILHFFNGMDRCLTDACLIGRYLFDAFSGFQLSEKLLFSLSAIKHKPCLSLI